MPAPQQTETTHQLLLLGRPVSYSLRRSSRRSIGLAVDHRGLRVSAPRRARLDEIQQLIEAHAYWVMGKLVSWENRPKPLALDVRDGTTLNLLGRMLTLRLVPARRNGWVFTPAELVLSCTTTVDAHKLLKKALGEQARHFFAGRLQVLAGKMGLPTPALRLSSARTRWGSCSHQGQVSLNWRLIFMSPAIVDYVVIHELAHLREMNHSPRFWAVVETYCPDWRALRRELTERGRTLPALHCQGEN